MSLPPFEIPQEKVERPSEGRPFVWWALLVLFLMLITSTLYSLVRPEPGAATERQQLLRELDKLSSEFLLRTTGRPKEEARAFLEEAESRLLALDLKTRGARGTRARAMLILRQHISPDERPNFSDLNVDADDVARTEDRPEVIRGRTELNAALRDIYRAESLTEEQAQYLADKIRRYAGDQWPYGLAIERARELAGEPTSEIDLTFGFVFLGIMTLGAGLWVVYFAFALSGRAAPKGIPLRGSSTLVADSLAMKMLLFFGVFLFLPSLVLVWASPELRDSLWTRTAAMTLVIIVALFIASRSMFGEKISLAAIGLKSENIGRDILWGVGAWLANWPIIAVLLFVGLKLAPYVPSGGHPVSEQLLIPGAFLPILIQAAVYAPLLEEFFFRGCLYQGLQLRLRSVFWAIFLSSLAFAAVHPQGVAMWLGLGWVGAMGALLTRQTGSLLPAIVMHAVHNGSILIFSYFVRGLA